MIKFLVELFFLQTEAGVRRLQCVMLLLELTAGMPAALSLLCLSSRCVCVHAETPDGLLRCGWMNINSTTTLQGRQPRAKPLAGLLSSCLLVHRQRLRYKFGYVSNRLGFIFPQLCLRYYVLYTSYVVSYILSTNVFLTVPNMVLFPFPLSYLSSSPPDISSITSSRFFLAVSQIA